MDAYQCPTPILLGAWVCNSDIFSCICKASISVFILPASAKSSLSAAAYRIQVDHKGGSFGFVYCVGALRFNILFLVFVSVIALMLQCGGNWIPQWEGRVWQSPFAIFGGERSYFADLMSTLLAEGYLGDSHLAVYAVRTLSEKKVTLILGTCEN